MYPTLLLWFFIVASRRLGMPAAVSRSSAPVRKLIGQRTLVACYESMEGTIGEFLRDLWEIPEFERE